MNVPMPLLSAAVLLYRRVFWPHPSWLGWVDPPLFGFVAGVLVRRLTDKRGVP